MKSQEEITEGKLKSQKEKEAENKITKQAIE